MTVHTFRDTGSITAQGQAKSSETQNTPFLMETQDPQSRAGILTLNRLS